MSLPPPYRYQHRIRNTILRRGNLYVMADCGVGKTRGTLMAIDTLVSRYPGIPTLIFAPVYPALTTWPEEIEKWTPHLSYVVLHGASKNFWCSTANTKNIIIVPYSSLAWLYEAMLARTFKVARRYHLVLDEATYVKAPDSKRSQMLRDMIPMFSNFRVALSGTPAPNGEQDLWSPVYLLDNGARLGKSYWGFREKYFFPISPPHFRMAIKPNAEYEIYNKIKDITLRLAAEDYLELPELVHNEVPLKLTPKLKSQYDYLEQEFMLRLSSTEVTTAASTAALGNKLRQFLQGAVYFDDYTGFGTVVRAKRLHTLKAEALKAMVEEANGEPILAAIQFKFELDILREVFKKDIPCIAGKTPRAKALKYIQDWNDGKLPLLLAHPASIGHGVNLQTGGHRIVWLALPWSLEHFIQFTKRLHRNGQKANRVIMHFIIFAGTKDVAVAKCLAKKDMTQAKMLEYLKGGN